MDLYEFIVQYKQVHDGVAPSYTEIVEATGINIARVRDRLEELEAEGKIELVEGRRTIHVVGSEWIPPC